MYCAKTCDGIVSHKLSVARFRLEILVLKEHRHLVNCQLRGEGIEIVLPVSIEG